MGVLLKNSKRMNGGVLGFFPLTIHSEVFYYFYITAGCFLAKLPIVSERQCECMCDCSLCWVCICPGSSGIDSSLLLTLCRTSGTENE